MALSFTKRSLYGGTISVNLPIDTIDASDLRQIPDHQEVFLRPKSLTSIIFEINEYQTSQNVALAVESTSTAIVQSSSSATGSVSDEAAASYHFDDLIQPPDHLSVDGIDTASTQLPQASISKFAAYHSTATIITPEVDLSFNSTLPVTWQSNPVQKEYQTKSQQLLLRMGEYGTDFCVRIDVPLKELGNAQSDAALTELAVADLIMKNIVESLDIRDFALFGAGD